MFQNMAHVRQAPDVVFNLDVSGYRADEKSVGISVIDLSTRPDLKQFQNGYFNKLSEFASRYLEQGLNVKLLSFCERQGDRRAANALYDRLGDQWGRRVRIINYEGDIDAFLSEFSACQVIVGTRFHSVVLALLLRQNLVPVIYSDKTYSLLSDLNLANHSYRIEDIDKVDVDQVISAAKNAKPIDESIVLEAEKQFQELDRFLGRQSTQSQ
jgi:colanic acid/amylovoran biosynthesis protein